MEVDRNHQQHEFVIPGAGRRKVGPPSHRQVREYRKSASFPATTSTLSDDEDDGQETAVCPVENAPHRKESGQIGQSGAAKSLSSLLGASFSHLEDGFHSGPTFTVIRVHGRVPGPFTRDFGIHESDDEDGDEGEETEECYGTISQQQVHQSSSAAGQMLKGSEPEMLTRDANANVQVVGDVRQTGELEEEEVRGLVGKQSGSCAAPRPQQQQQQHQYQQHRDTTLQRHKTSNRPPPRTATVPSNMSSSERRMSQPEIEVPPKKHSRNRRISLPPLSFFGKKNHGPPSPNPITKATSLPPTQSGGGLLGVPSPTPRRRGIRSPRLFRRKKSGQQAPVVHRGNGVTSIFYTPSEESISSVELSPTEEDAPVAVPSSDPVVPKVASSTVGASSQGAQGGLETFVPEDMKEDLRQLVSQHTSLSNLIHYEMGVMRTQHHLSI